MGTFGRGIRRAARWQAAVLAAAALLAAGCASGSGELRPAGTGRRPPRRRAAAAATAGDRRTTEPMAEGALAPPERATTAFTYNPALAPEGATIEVDVDAPRRVDRGPARRRRAAAEPGVRRARARQRLRPDRRRGRPALPEPGRPGRGAGQAVHRPGLRQPAERDLARPAHRRRRRRRVDGRRCRSRSPTAPRRRS